jgi:hypothetical protein
MRPLENRPLKDYSLAFRLLSLCMVRLALGRRILWGCLSDSVTEVTELCQDACGISSV